MNRSDGVDLDATILGLSVTPTRPFDRGTLVGPLMEGSFQS